MATYEYDAHFNPIAPVLPIQISAPLSPSTVAVSALIDSGADATVIPRFVAEQLSLRRVDIVLAQGFGGNLIECPVFAARLTLESYMSKIIRVLSWAENYAILGRDMLNQWKLNLDGPQGLLSLNL